MKGIEEEGLKKKTYQYLDVQWLTLLDWSKGLSKQSGSKGEAGVRRWLKPSLSSSFPGLCWMFQEKWFVALLAIKVGDVG